MTIPWDMESLSRPPVVYDASGFDEPGVRAIFYDGPAYRGRPTHVFAWLGFPPGATDGKPVPGVVLVHGGGGTAFAEWVRLWTSRGYAAISMDLNGRVPIAEGNRWRSHDHAGPAGIPVYVDADKGIEPFTEPSEPQHDGWPYHAVSAVVLGHSLLRSFPAVDADRIGITGISWGGWTTSIVVGIDHRFRCAAPVYGCGLIEDGSKWMRAGTLVPKRDHLWLQRWDPSHYLPLATLPMLWINGTNDDAYWPTAWARSTRLPRGPRTLSMQLRMPHAHGGPGERPAEIHAFVDHHLRGGPPLAVLCEQREASGVALATFDPPGSGRIAHVELLYTISRDPVWPDRHWDAAPATFDRATHRVIADVPVDASAYVLNTIDHAGRIVSAEPVFR